MRVGHVRRTIRVTGHRRGLPGSFVATLTSPEPIIELPVTYEAAYGGYDCTDIEIPGTIASTRGTRSVEGSRGVPRRRQKCSCRTSNTRRVIRPRLEALFPDASERAACDRIRAGTFDACVVAGVESYLSAGTLEWLELNNQLHGAGALRNAWGFVPGEAAGAVFLVGHAIERLGVEPLARVLSVGMGFEQNRIKTEMVCTGERADGGVS